MPGLWHLTEYYKQYRVIGMTGLKVLWDLIRNSEKMILPDFLMQLKDGEISHKPAKQVNCVEVKFGRLYLDKLQINLPAGTGINNIKASLNNQDIAVSAANTNGYTEISLNGLQMRLGDKLQITFE